MKLSLQDYCLAHDKLALLQEWNFEENGHPTEVSYVSRRKVWWRCAKGHRWQAAVYTRTGSGSGCPYCAGNKPWPGETDLATQHPQLAAQWHPTKNGDLTPTEVLPGSHREVWWRCDRGHVWQAGVNSRVKGSGCPVCAGRRLEAGENDLSATHPQLAREWHPEKNGALRPSDVAAGTQRKVWWQCAKGHAWQAAVVSRVWGAGCPVCAGKQVLPGENDLASTFPALAAQWHPAKNGFLSPSQVSPYSNRKVWWRCELGHDYAAAVAARAAGGSGCPYCAGRKVLAGFNDLSTRAPALAAQWHPTLNGALTPEQVTPGSHKKIWWRCPEGHVWRAVVYSRTGPRGCGCPVCAGKTRRAFVQPPPAEIIE